MDGCVLDRQRKSDRRRGRRSCRLLSCFISLCLLLLTGCSTLGEALDFLPASSEGEESEAVSEEVTPFASKLRIVLPKDGSVELYARVREIGDAVSEKTGLPYSVVFGGSPSSDHPAVYELVIGYGSHPDCDLYMKGLKKS